MFTDLVTVHELPLTERNERPLGWALPRYQVGKARVPVDYTYLTASERVVCSAL